MGVLNSKILSNDTGKAFELSVIWKRLLELKKTTFIPDTEYGVLP